VVPGGNFATPWQALATLDAAVGQPDFMPGALHSPDGLAIIALPSWHPKADASTVLPRAHGPGDVLPAQFYRQRAGRDAAQASAGRGAGSADTH
jgi:hypothetical protein